MDFVKALDSSLLRLTSHPQKIKLVVSFPQTDASRMVVFEQLKNIELNSRSCGNGFVFTIEKSRNSSIQKGSRTLALSIDSSGNFMGANGKRSQRRGKAYYSSMQTIAEGKDAVLEYLEHHALTVTNEQPGENVSFRDDAGSLILCLAGHTFFGSGTMSLSGNFIEVTDGLVHKARKPS